jgi:hypothetical protein
MNQDNESRGNKDPCELIGFVDEVREESGVDGVGLTH